MNREKIMKITLNQINHFVDTKINYDHHPHAESDLAENQYFRYKQLRALKGLASEEAAYRKSLLKGFNPKRINRNIPITNSNGYTVDVDLQICDVTIDIKGGHQYNKLKNLDLYDWFWWYRIEIPGEYVDITMVNGRPYELLTQDFPAVIDISRWEHHDEGLLNRNDFFKVNDQYIKRSFSVYKTINEFWELEFGV